MQTILLTFQYFGNATRYTKGYAADLKTLVSQPVDESRPLLTASVAVNSDALAAFIKAAEKTAVERGANYTPGFPQYLPGKFEFPGGCLRVYQVDEGEYRAFVHTHCASGVTNEIIAVSPDHELTTIL